MTAIMARCVINICHTHKAVPLLSVCVCVVFVCVDGWSVLGQSRAFSTTCTYYHLPITSAGHKTSQYARNTSCGGTEQKVALCHFRILWYHTPTPTPYINIKNIFSLTCHVWRKTLFVVCNIFEYMIHLNKKTARNIL